MDHEDFNRIKHESNQGYALHEERSVNCPFICRTKFGTPLKAQIIGIYTKGKVYTRANGTVQKCMKNGVKPDHGSKMDWTKTYLPKLHTTTLNSSLIVIDVDGNNEAWVRDRILDAGANGVISPFVNQSGRLKAFLPVEHINHHPSRDEMMATIANVMGEDFAAVCDRSGMDSTFLTPSALEAAREAMGLEHHQLVMVKKPTPNFLDPKFPQWILNLIKDEFGAFYGFVKKLMAWTKRGLQGTLQIPREKWAEECGVDQSTITRWINRFIENGWLTVTSHSYVPGKRSKMYSFSGYLKVLANMIAMAKPFPSVKYLVCKRPTMRPSCPSFVDQGTHEATLHMAKYAPTKEAFEDIYKSNPGWDLRGRWERAKAIWNSKAKKFNLATF